MTFSCDVFTAVERACLTSKKLPFFYFISVFLSVKRPSHSCRLGAGGMAISVPAKELCAVSICCGIFLLYTV